MGPRLAAGPDRSVDRVRKNTPSFAHGLLQSCAPCLSVGNSHNSAFQNSRSMPVREEQVLRRPFAPKGDEVTA
jgi:hypothetical protein